MRSIALLIHSSSLDHRPYLGAGGYMHDDRISSALVGRPLLVAHL